jgi:hypothetical protein
MSSLLLYVGQAVFATTHANKKVTQGTGIIVAKTIQKGAPVYDILGMDGRFYKEIPHDRITFIKVADKTGTKIVYGPAMTGTVNCRKIADTDVKNGKDAWVKWLGETMAAIKDGKLIAEGFNGVPVEKPFIEEEDKEDVEEPEVAAATANKVTE